MRFEKSGQNLVHNLGIIGCQSIQVLDEVTHFYFRISPIRVSFYL